MMTLSVVRRSLGLPLAAGLLLAASWASDAQGIERGRRSSVNYSSATYSSGNGSSGNYVEGAVVANDAASAETGDCESCGTPQRGCRRGCCANAWDGYCEERRGACGGDCRRGCCANAWDGYCDEQRGINWGCRSRRCKTSCCAPACDSCGCEGATDVTTDSESPSTPAAQPEPAAQPKSPTAQPKPAVQPKPAPPEPPKPGLDRSATLRRVR